MFAEKDTITLLLWRNLVATSNINNTIDQFASISSNYRKLLIEDNKVQYALPNIPYRIIDSEATALVVSVIFHLQRTNHRIFYNLYGYNTLTIYAYVINLILKTFTADQLKLDCIKIIDKDLL